jgi:hypothetical protein
VISPNGLVPKADFAADSEQIRASFLGHSASKQFMTYLSLIHLQQRRASAPIGESCWRGPSVVELLGPVQRHDNSREKSETAVIRALQVP